FIISAYNSYSDHSDDEFNDENPATLINLITYLIIILLAFIEILLTENIRTVKQLIPTLIFKFLNVLIIFVCHTIIYNDLINKIYFDILTECLFILMTINLIIEEITAIIFHPYLNREIKKILQKPKIIIFCCKNKINNNNINSISSNNIQNTILIRNLSGKDIGTKQTIDNHFEMLRKSWNVK
ncbi:hypothetical protein Mgra_00005316, partial [Meloidogyne graminicola]